MDDSLEQYLITSRGKTCNNKKKKKKNGGPYFGQMGQNRYKIRFFVIFLSLIH